MGKPFGCHNDTIRMSHIPLYVGICAAALLWPALNAAPRKVGVSAQSELNPKTSTPRCRIRPRHPCRRAIGIWLGSYLSIF
jgi:hypothetical protein